MEILDDLTGYEFEEMMVDIFEELGFSNVRLQPKSGDEGKDIVMEEEVRGEKRAVIVECKHKNSVGRPDIQKLYSATLTHEYEGNKRCMLVTTGTFSEPARKEAEKLNNHNNKISIELLDGNDIIEKSGEIGLDLYNGKIEIICNKSLQLNNIDDPNYYVRAAFEKIKNFDASHLPQTAIHCELYPFFSGILRFEKEVELDDKRNISGSVTLSVWGLEHDENLPKNDELLKKLITGLDENGRIPIPETELADIDQSKLNEVFDSVKIYRFSKSKTAAKKKFRNHIKDSLKNKHQIEAREKGSDFVHSFNLNLKENELFFKEFIPFYVPYLEMTVKLKEHTYELNGYASGDKFVAMRNTIQSCFQCDKTENAYFYYCKNCGSINCSDHIKTERLEGTPICTGCAITNKFMGEQKYFSSTDNLDEFRDIYDDMSFFEKLQENDLLFKNLMYAVAALMVIIFAMILASVL